MLEFQKIARQKNEVALNGCTDPFWSDGDNMNLIRDQIIGCKYLVRKICIDNGFAIPDAYYIPVPPEVSIGYMAKLKSKDQKVKERIRNLLPHYQKDTYSGMTDKLPAYNASQNQLF